MPLYDFECLDCKARFELTLSLHERETESPKKQCPSCSSKNVSQRMTFEGAVIGGGPSANYDMPPCATGRACPSGKCPYSD